MLNPAKRIALIGAAAASLSVAIAPAEARTEPAAGEWCEWVCLAGTFICCIQAPVFCTSACVAGGGACISVICGAG